MSAFFIGDANQHPADFANETLRDPAALVVLAQIGIVLDLDFQFPVWIRYVRSSMFSTKVAITVSRIIGGRTVCEFHLKFDVSTMAPACVFMGDHAHVLGA